MELTNKSDFIRNKSFIFTNNGENNVLQKIKNILKDDEKYDNTSKIIRQVLEQKEKKELRIRNKYNNVLRCQSVCYSRSELLDLFLSAINVVKKQRKRRR